MTTTPFTEHPDYPLFFSLPLFEGLSDEQLHSMFTISTEVILSPNDYLLREGDNAEHFFVVMYGMFEVKKYDEKYKIDHVLLTLSKGEVIGEMSLFDGTKRAATVQSVSFARLRQIAYKDFFKLASNNNSFYKIFLNLSENLSQRMRSSNSTTVQTIQKLLDESKHREVMGKFIVFVVSVLCLFAFSLNGLAYLVKESPSSTLVTMIVLAGSFIFVFTGIKLTKLPYATVGLTLKNWRKSIFESVLFTTPILILFVIIKLILVNYVSGYLGSPVFQLWTTWKSTSINGVFLSAKIVWFVSLLLYCIVGCIAQEFLARGGLQAPLSLFLTGKHKHLSSILVSNLIFSTMHLFLGALVPLTVFFPGIYFGWLFKRHENLIGCSIAHMLIGAWGLFFVGLGGF